MKNLWEKDRKTVYKELYSQYLQEGYSPKEAKKYASEETEEFMDLIETQEWLIENTGLENYLQSQMGD